MTLFVACSIPAGLTVEQGGQKINLNGPHVGVDMDNLPRNGMVEDSAARASGYGITSLDGSQADAFEAWVKGVTESPQGKPLAQPFAPIASGALKWAKSEGELRKEIAKSEGLGIAGLDPEKDLPAGLESADTKKGK